MYGVPYAWRLRGTSTACALHVKCAEDEDEEVMNVEFTTRLPFLDFFSRLAPFVYVCVCVCLRVCLDATSMAFASDINGLCCAEDGGVVYTRWGPVPDSF